MATTYDNQFSHDNVYGHALQLLRTVCQPGSSVHLDVGCGFGRIAEPLVDALNRVYVGIDADCDGLASLKQRGFEAHHFWLGDYETNLAFFRTALQGRQLGSISIIDTLEHLYDPKSTIAALRTLAAECAAPIVVSVPNIAHTDIAIKLLMGRFDYTEDGLLDRTHVNFFTEARLLSMMASAGWHATMSKNDVLRRNSDQHFPETLLALSEGSALNQFLRSLREHADDLGSVNQLVRVFMCGPETGESDLAEREENSGTPFLTVIVRTDGRKPGALRKTFTSLAEQTSKNFNVVVVGSGLNLKRQISVEQVIEENRPWLAERNRLVRIEHTNDAAGLNAGFGEADGCYAAILNEGDFVLDNWVEAFEQLAKDNAGAVLANSYTTQADREERLDHDYSQAPESSVFDGAGGPATFDVFTRLQNEFGASPCLAFPRSIYSDLGYRFDDTVVGGEVWDFLTKTIFLCGIAASQESAAAFHSAPISGALSNPDSGVGLAGAANYRTQTIPPDLLPTGNAHTLHVAALQPRIYPNLRKTDEGIKAQNAQLNREMVELRQYAEKLEGALEELKSYSASRDTAFAALTTATEELKGYSQALEDRARNLAENNRVADVANQTLHADIDSLNVHIASQNLQLEKLASANKSLSDNLMSAEQHANQLETEVQTLSAESKAANDQLQLIMNTRSWRLMSPARRLRNFVRRTTK